MTQQDGDVAYHAVPIDTAVDLKRTKSGLKSAHNQFVSTYGTTTNEQRKEIINVLGGFDEMLSHLWNSTSLGLSQNQLQSLADIFETPQPQTNRANIAAITRRNTKTNLEDEDDESITFTFKDEDIILFRMFSHDTAKKIQNALTSSILKIFFFISVLILIILLLICGRLYGGFGIVPVEIYYAYETFFIFIASLYTYAWILCANMTAMKMLIQNFVFWFKMFYLAIYLVTFAMLLDLERSISYESVAIYYSIPMAIILEAGCLGVAMITEALNIGQSSKLLLTTIAFARFAFSFLYNQRASLYPESSSTGRYYLASIITLPFGMLLYLLIHNCLCVFQTLDMISLWLY